MLLAQCETLGEYISAWRIKIRTGFYHRAKKPRPVKGLISSTAIRRGFMRIAIVLQCDVVGEACLARRVRSARIVIILYIYSAGEACLAPTEPCGGKAKH